MGNSGETNGTGGQPVKAVAESTAGANIGSVVYHTSGEELGIVKILELKEDEFLLFNVFPRRPEGQDPVRTKGVHLTDVIRDLMETAQMMKTASGSTWVQSDLELAGEIGFMWEEVLSEALKERLPCRIGEMGLDGITMSPDGVEMEEDEPILSEYKVVWASSRRSPVDNFKWMCQVKGYCKALGMTKVRMYILYINGDWKPPKPQYKRFLVTFTQLELDETWEMLLAHARGKEWI